MEQGHGVLHSRDGELPPPQYISDSNSEHLVRTWRTWKGPNTCLSRRYLWDGVVSENFLSSHTGSVPGVLGHKSPWIWIGQFPLVGSLLRPAEHSLIFSVYSSLLSSVEGRVSYGSGTLPSLCVESQGRKQRGRTQFWVRLLIWRSPREIWGY